MKNLKWILFVLLLPVLSVRAEGEPTQCLDACNQSWAHCIARADQNQQWRLQYCLTLDATRVFYCLVQTNTLADGDRKACDAARDACYDACYEADGDTDEIL